MNPIKQKICIQCARAAVIVITCGTLLATFTRTAHTMPVPSYVVLLEVSKHQTLDHKQTKAGVDNAYVSSRDTAK